MMMETTLCRRLPPVSARGSTLLAGIGIICLMLGLAAGQLLLAPAVVSTALGFATGLHRWLLVSRGQAYPREGHMPLLAATFVNATLVFFAGLAGLFLLRFGA